jgi:hypothetical protein
VHAILGDQYEDAPMPVLDVPHGAGARGFSSNSGDPSFWLKEF